MEIFISTNIEVQREKAEVCNNLDKVELVTDKKTKSKYRENLSLTTDTKDVREKLEKN